MEYIHGNTAQEVTHAYEGMPPRFREKFWSQVATIMVQLASVRLPKIGSIYRDSEYSDSFIVGPLVETETGPYVSASEFYRDYPPALGSSLQTEGGPVHGQHELLRAFQTIASSLPTQGDGFGLVNDDLSPNNILVDHDFNVLAVIDWDCVVALPDIALYRLPFLMGISCAVPGIVPWHPLQIKRNELGRQFAEIVEAVSRRHITDNPSGIMTRPTFHFTRAGFFSKGALAFRSLAFVRMQQDFVNDEWLRGLQWLSEHAEAEVEKFYSEG